MIYLNTHPEQLNVAHTLGLVSAQRRDKALRYLREEDRQLSLAVYRLLQEALEKEYGIIQPPELAFGPQGKPFLRNYPQIHFNLSHCPGAALCVVGDAPLGCDIERVEGCLDEALCRQCCSQEEMEAILRAENPPLAFCLLWTRKEAFLKYTGEGLTDHLPGLLDLPRAATVHFESHVLPERSLVYTICR